jgi:hypothetical protein
MYETNPDKKVEVLMFALEERYKAIHEIRSRLQNMSIWSLGVFTAASGWLFQSDIYFLRHEQITLLLVLVLLILILFKTYIKDLEKGFKTQQQVAADIEAELGFYNEGVFAEKTLFPLRWKDSGTEDGDGKYFDTTRILILFGTVLLALTILSKGSLLF